MCVKTDVGPLHHYRRRGGADNNNNHPVHHRSICHDMIRHVGNNNSPITMLYINNTNNNSRWHYLIHHLHQALMSAKEKVIKLLYGDLKQIFKYILR